MPIVTKTQLEHQYRRTAYLLKQAKAANAAATTIEKRYQDALAPIIAQFEADNPELAAAYKEARENKTAAAEQAQTARDKLAEDAEYYWLTTDNADEKPFGGLGKRDYTEYDIRPGEEYLLLRQLRERAPFLLTINDKALKKFVANNAVKNKEGDLELPYPLCEDLSALIVISRRIATIGDDALIKAAPDADPDTITAEEDALEADAIAAQDEAHDQALMDELAATAPMMYDVVAAWQDAPTGEDDNGTKDDIPSKF